MTKQNIYGIYSLYSFIDAERTLTGDNRNAPFTIGSNSINLYLLGGSKYESPNSAALLKNNKFTVKAFKFKAIGGDGARIGVGTEQNQIAIYGENSGQRLFDNVIFRASNWNEWNECNVVIEPFLNSGSDSDNHVYLNFDKSYSWFYLDDYNIQNAYIGEKVKVQLELKIDTAGVDIYNGGLI